MIERTRGATQRCGGPSDGSGVGVFAVQVDEAEQSQNSRDGGWGQQSLPSSAMWTCTRSSIPFGGSGVGLGDYADHQADRLTW